MTIFNFEQPYTPEVALESIIANEGSFQETVTSIANFFPSLKSMFAGSADVLTDLASNANGLLNKLSGFTGMSVDTADKLSFQDFAKVKIRVPEGFTGNLNTYSIFLARSNVFLNTRAIPALDSFYTSLASFASNKESKISLLDTSRIYKEIDDEYKQLVKESITYFGKRQTTQSHSTIGDSYLDNQEYRDSIKRTKELAKTLNPKEVSKILDRVNKISRVLDIIIQDATHRDFDKASHAAVKSLATAVYSMAEVVEYYAVNYYRITDLAFSMKENEAIFKKLH